jgi:hypothetical protein
MPGMGKGQSPKSKMAGMGGGQGGSGAGSAFNPMDPKTAAKAKMTKEKANTVAKGKRDPNAGAPVIRYTGDPEGGARAGTPMYQVNPQYRRATESAVGKENIPAEYRQRVKDYINAINGGK